MTLFKVLEILFVLGFIVTFLAFIAERYVVISAIRKESGSNLPLPFTQKKRLEYLETYKEIVHNKNDSMVTYWFLYLLYKHGLKYIAVVFVLVLFLVLDVQGS